MDEVDKLFSDIDELDRESPWDMAVKIGIALVGLIIFFKLLGTIMGLLLLLGVGAVIGHVANQVVPRQIPYGFVGATGAGLLGAWLGTKVLGAWGPQIAGLRLFPGILGASALAMLIHAKMTMDRAKALESYQAAADTSDPYSMKILGKFRLVELLGKGATARVYRAVPNRSLDDSESVALKVLNSDSTEDEEFMGRFKREISLCSKLDNPSIIKMLDHGEQEGLNYIAMELIPEGQTLRSQIKEGGAPIVEAAGWLTQLMLALDHAHKLDVVHRDIKPDNILMKGNRCKISDFGLSRGKGDASLTKTGTALGTPSYMSPEQIEGGKVTPSCDQYALGVVAYELFTGEKPFTGREPMRVLFKHLHEPAPCPRDLRPDLPQQLSDIVLKMLEKEEADRFPTMGDAAKEMMAFMKSYKPKKKAS